MLVNALEVMLKKKWYFQGFNGTPALLFGPAQSMVVEMPAALGFGYDTGCIIFFEKDVCYYLYAWDDLFAVGKNLLEHARKDPKYFNWMLQKDTEVCAAAAQELRAIDLEKLSGLSVESLCQLWNKVHALYSYLLSVSHCVEGFTLTTEETIRSLVQKEFPNDPNAMSLLTTPPVHSFMSTEHYDLLCIAKKCIGSGTALFTPAIMEQLQNHTHKYFWKLNNYTTARVLTVDDFKSELNDILKEPKKIESIIREYELHPELLQKRAELISRIHSQELKDLLHMNHIIFQIHDRRKEYITQIIHYADAVLGELAKLNYIPHTDVRYILSEESEKLSDLAEELRERRKKSVYIIYPGGKKEVITGARAEEIINELQKQNGDEKHTEEIKGNCAVPGVVRGKVKVCRGVDEIAKMQKGDILVACMTQPEFVPAMRLASAVITDEGGLTCHAAIISRELGIPCIIGTKIATRVFKDGDMVEVDANKGLVKKLN